MRKPIARALFLAFGVLTVTTVGAMNTEAQVTRLPALSGASTPLPAVGFRVAQYEPQPFVDKEPYMERSFMDKMAAPEPLYERTKVGRSCRYFGGVDYLYVRPHFSEAIAFARGTQNLPNQSFRTESLDFDYDSSARAFLGVRWGCGNEIRFTYWHMEGDVQVNGVPVGAGGFIVDPFGGVVGNAVVLNPADRRFGTPVLGGTAIATSASVDVDIYDIDFVFAPLTQHPNWNVSYNVGVRIADIEQFYQSTITGGLLAQTGSFTADFIGAGPKVGIQMKRFFGSRSQWSIFADVQGALLLGSYNVASSVVAVAPAPGVATQDETMTRITPVAETELGVRWQATDAWKFQLAWMFQAWYDMGTSGGTFGGFYSGADDNNIMSFDGLTARVEFQY